MHITTASSGPNGKEFDFRLNNRNDNVQLDQLAAALFQIRATVPLGIVCFFASYSYMDSVLGKLESRGQLETLRAQTTVFHEPRHSKDLERLLDRYAEQVFHWKSSGAVLWTDDKFYNMREHTQAASARGAIIFCVVGGKLSEGINFSDDLARQVSTAFVDLLWCA